MEYHPVGRHLEAVDAWSTSATCIGQTASDRAPAEQQAGARVSVAPSGAVAACLPMTSVPLLRVSGVSVRFGGILALENVSFDVRQGGICGLIGPNGAGKTTLFNCLSRLYRVREGAIELDGRSILSARPHEIAELGISRTFQNLALFRALSVRENVLAGRHCRSRGGFLACALRLPGVEREERRARARADALLEELDLTRVADENVMALPFAVRKRVELARALACEPRLLLLDEPAGGLEREEVERLCELIVGLRRRLDLTILLVEHHLGLVMRVCDKTIALDSGRVIAEGTPAELQRHAEVIRAYLGVRA
jgi:branched-chain amino acid transport system ATP-binding protein